MSSSRPSPSSRDDNSFSSRSGDTPSGSNRGTSRPDSSRSTGSSRPGAESRATPKPPTPPRMNAPRTGAATTGAGAASGSGDTSTKTAASGSAFKWVGMVGVGALALGGFLLMNGKSSSTAAISNNASMQGNRPASAAAATPGGLTLFVGADVSKSVTPTIRTNSMDGLKFVLRQSVPAGTSLHFVFYDKTARTRPNTVEFYEPRDLDEVANEFKAYSSRPEKGTTQADAIKRLRQEATDLPAGTPYAFVLITDGEDYDKAATKEQAKELAGVPDFRGLMVIGTQMESKDRIPLRDQIQDTLSPLGNKRLVCGPEVTEHDADTFQALMNP